MFTGTARVIDGYGLAYFKVNGDTEVGELGEITLELRPPRQKSLSETISVIAVDNPNASSSNKDGKKKTPNIVVDYIYKDNEYFKVSGWDENTVAAVLEDKDSVIIYVSGENKNLTKLVVRAQRKNEVAVDNIKNKYLEHISFYAFMLRNNKKMNKYSSKTFDEEYEEHKERVELFTASETICGMISDFFEMIITESVEK